MVDIYIKNYTMEKHFLISESEKSRILNLHKNLLNEHGTMMEATTGVDLTTPEKQINTIFNMSNAADNKIKVVDGSGKSLPIDGFSKKDAAKGWMYLRSTKKPQVFDIKDSKGMKMSVNGKVLKAIPNRDGEVLTCTAGGKTGAVRGIVEKGQFCYSRFEIPLGNVQPSDIKNSYKKLVANVRFDASKWSDDANARINGKA